jgi:KDO2-lipid IV(A) lauroyltransferase
MVRGMSKHGAVRDLAEWSVVWPMLRTLQHLPLPVARLESAALAGALRAAIPRLERTARRNLALALPEALEARREEILDGVFRSLGRSLLTFARFPQLNRGNLDRWIRYEGYEHFQQAQACGRGVLFLTGHLGHWELSALAHGLHGHPLHVMVRRLDNPYLDRLVSRYRTLSGNGVLEKTDSPRRIFELLRSNQAVGMLVDQNASLEGGVFVDFFGVKACASTGLARIALRTGAPVVPGFALWEEAEQRYVLRFWPPLEILRTGDAENDVQVNTQRVHTLLEQVIRRWPDQWLWIHRRWKTRPPGEPAIY